MRPVSVSTICAGENVDFILKVREAGSQNMAHVKPYSIVRDGSAHYLAVEWRESEECVVQVMLVTAELDIELEEAHDPEAQGLPIGQNEDAIRLHALIHFFATRFDVCDRLIEN